MRWDRNTPEVLVRISDDTLAILIEIFRIFLQSLKANTGILHLLGHDRFLPNPMLFIINPTSSSIRRYIVSILEASLNNPRRKYGLRSLRVELWKVKFFVRKKICPNDIWISYHTESKKECRNYLKYYSIVKLTIWKANHFFCNLTRLLTAQYVTVTKTCKMNGWNMKIMPEKNFPEPASSI